VFIKNSVVVTSICILPMSKSEEFDNDEIRVVQKTYFLRDLPKKNGEYRYREQDLHNFI
jgi:hypothetical protein